MTTGAEDKTRLLSKVAREAGYTLKAEPALVQPYRRSGNADAPPTRFVWTLSRWGRVVEVENTLKKIRKILLEEEP